MKGKQSQYKNIAIRIINMELFSTYQPRIRSKQKSLEIKVHPILSILYELFLYPIFIDNYPVVIDQNMLILSIISFCCIQLYLLLTLIKTPMNSHIPPISKQTLKYTIPFSHPKNPQNFAGIIETFHHHPEADSKLWLARKELGIRHIPLATIQNDCIQIENGEGSLINYIKQHEQYLKIKIMLDIMKTIKFLGDTYGLFYIDSQMMKVSKVGSPLIWIHRNFKLNYRQLPIQDAQYGEQIFCDNTKRVFNSLIQLPHDILTMDNLINYMEENDSKLQWKVQCQSFPVNLKNVSIHKIQSHNDSKIRQRGFSRDTALFQNSTKNPENGVCSRISQNLAKIRSREKYSDHRSPRSVTAKEIPLYQSNSLTQPNLSDKKYFQGFHESTSHNSSHTNSEALPKKQQYGKSCAVHLTKPRKQSENLRAVKQLIPAHHKFPYLTFSTRITCDTEANDCIEQGISDKKQKQPINSCPNHQQPTDLQPNFFGSSNKSIKTCRKWTDTYGGSENINWGIQSEIAQQEDSGICEELDRLFDGDRHGKRDSRQLKQSQIAREVDQLFQNQEKQGEEDYIKDFVNVLL